MVPLSGTIYQPFRPTSPATVSVVVVGRQPEAQIVVVLDAVAVFVTLAVFVTGLGVAYSSGQ